MGLTEMLFLSRGRAYKKYWRAAMADSAIHLEVIIVGNKCVYREYELNEKFFFFLELERAKVAYRNLICLT